MFNLFNNEDGVLEKKGTPSPRPSSSESWRVTPGQGGMKQPIPPSEDTQKALSMVKERLGGSSNWADLQIGRDLMEQSFKDPMSVQGILSGAYSDEEIKAPEQTPEQDQPSATLPPLPDEDPAAFLGGLNSNMFKGVGDYMGRVKPPTPPDPKQAAVEMMDAEGKQTMFDMNKIPKWQDSDAFYGGLLSMGLNLLSGNDLATSFNAAGQYFDNAFGKEKRQAWAQDLVNQGYDAQDIQRWIETGDNKDLTDPMEKKMRMQQFNLGQQNLNRAIYENSPEMRQFALDQAGFDNALKVAQLNAQINYQNASLKQRWAAQEARGQKPTFTARDFSQIQSSIMPTIKVANQRIQYSNDALRDVEQIKKYKKEGNLAGMQGSYRSFQANMARAMKGGGATLTDKDLEATTALTDWYSDLSNKASIKTTGYPTDQWIEAMATSARNDVYNQSRGVREVAQNAYYTYAPELGHDLAQNVISRIFGGTNVGDLTIDPRTGS